MNVRTTVALLALVLTACPSAVTPLQASDEYQVIATSEIGPMVTGLKRFRSDGTLIEDIFVPGNPGALATDGDFVYAWVGPAGRVDRFGLNGQFIETLFFTPQIPVSLDMEIDADKTIWFSTVDNAILQMSRGGQVLRRFPSAVSGQFELSSNGTIYTSQRNELRRYDRNGNLLSRTPTDFFFPWGVAIDEATQTLYHTSQLGDMNVYDISGGTPQFIRSVELATGGDTVDLSFIPWTGNLLVASVFSTYEIRPDGSIVQDFQTVFGFAAVAAPIPEPVQATAVMGMCFLWMMSRRARK